ncbi:hypothetical protein V5N11_003974 [Cardamine amara subsp. amara]|uniref:HAT C-terminal dimerisation domain-containing protein n=1 Tax=Cardamine amara subsp. amara TaxID=228776 RepID=A0ABD1BPI9_CARAN
MQFAKMCFDELYGEDSAESKELYDLVINILEDMFKDYSERYGKKKNVQPSQSQSQSSSSTQCSQDHQTDRMDVVDDELGYHRHRIEQRYNTLIKEIGVCDKNELESYLKEKVKNPEVMLGVDYNILSYWKLNNVKYHIPSQMARDLFYASVFGCS